MTTFIRDVENARITSAMADMGCYDHEYYAYGCAYIEEGKIKYRVSSDWEQVYSFISNSAANDIYPTPAISSLTREAALSGTETDTELILKLNLARKLQETYSKKFFMALDKLGSQPANDSAAKYIHAYRDEIDGLFDVDKLNLLEGLLQLACEQKVITKEHFKQTYRWLSGVWRQMEDDIIVKDTIERTLFGFAYAQGDKPFKYVTNANGKSICEQKVIAEQNGWQVSPILKKAYWFKHSNEFGKVRDSFQQKLQEVMNEDYLGIIKVLKGLPSPINGNLFEEQMAKVEKECTPEAIAALRMYGYRWNLLNKQRS